MRRLLGVMMAMGLAGPMSGVRADDAASAKAVIDKAIEASGGEARLEKDKAATWKQKGTFHGFGQAMPYTADFAVQLPNQSKVTIRGEFNDQKFEIMTGVNQKDVWQKQNGHSTELPASQEEEAREQLWVRWITHLVPLKSADFTLALLPEAQVMGKPAIGVRVSSKGHRDVDLYFDKDSGLLVRTLTKVKTDMGGEAKEQEQETLYADYQDVDGTKQAMKITIRRDKQPYIEAENSDMKLLDHLDPKTFAEE